MELSERLPDSNDLVAADVPSDSEDMATLETIRHEDGTG